MSSTAQPQVVTLGAHPYKARYENFIGGRWVAPVRAQFEYWQHTQLIIDVVAGRGGMFSLENGRDLRFLTRSRVYMEEEATQLDPVTSAG